MKYFAQKPVEEIYNNTLPRYPFKINNSYSFFVPVQEKFNINFIDIYLLKEEKAHGELHIQVIINKRATIYKFSIDKVSNKSSVRLIFENHHEVTDPIKIKIVVIAEGSPISICRNHKGHCVYVNGNLSKVYDINYRPKISIVMPTYNTNLGYLQQTIESVIDQVYDNWELCIVDDGSRNPKLTKYLKSFKDKRIVVRINNKNSGIVKSSNDALEMATGSFVSFLDHDDLLAVDALIEVVAALNKDKSLDFIYTDEDKVLADGSFTGSFYKPDFNYDMLLSHMYTCHLSTYRRTILKKVGYLREGYDGSQDYDLVLKVIEKTDKIYHIPKVLYHWRVTPGSTAQSILNKPEARINAVRAIYGHLKRIGREAAVSAGPFQGHYRVKYFDIDENKKKLGVIIPTKNNSVCIKALFGSMVRSGQNFANTHFLIVDNGSTEYEFKKMKNDLKCLNDSISRSPLISYEIVSYKKPFNFSAINNFAANKMKIFDYLLFLNDDIEIMHSGWIKEMLSHFIRPEVSAVGPKLLYLDHKIQHAGVFVGVNGVAGHNHKYMNDWEPGYFSRPHVTQEVTAITGACLMVRTNDFFNVGGFEEKLPRAFNDIDLCLKLREKSRKIIYTPYARLFHKESVSRGKDSFNEKKFQEAIEFMEKKWDIVNYVDPFYNPNLPKNCEGKAWI